MPSPLPPLKSAARAFFRHDLRLRREEGRLRVVLEAPRPGPVPVSPHALAQQREAELLQAMRGELAEVLDEDSELRAGVPHLARLERLLASHGLPALERVPLELLERALEQFESLVTNWSPAALACLRSRMAVTLRARLRVEGDAAVSG